VRLGEVVGDERLDSDSDLIA